jgi:AcrR family transcriptional regulator
MVSALQRHHGYGEGAKTREQILIAASSLFALQGYHGTTTREIASAVGITQPGLFFHFTTKKAIVEKLCELDLIPSLARLEALMIGEGTPAAKYAAFVVGEIRHTQDSPYDLRAQLSYEVLNDPDLSKYRALAGRIDDMVRLLIRAGQEAGEFIAVDAWLAQQTTTALLVRATMFSKELPVDHPGFDLESSATILIRGLLTDPNTLGRIQRQAEQLIRTQGHLRLH